MVQRHLPVFGQAIERVSYEDGCKVYFKDGSFAVCRFSGTEPLLRLCAEAPQVAQAQGYMNAFREQVMILMRESAEES